MQAIKAFRERRFVIIFSENEREADLAIPAQEVTAEAVIFLAKVASGLLCLALPRSRLKELEIDSLPSRYRATDTPFYSPVDAKEVEHSGISAQDRDDGDMMNAKDLKYLAKKFKIPIITIGGLTQFARSILAKKGQGDLTLK